MNREFIKKVSLLLMMVVFSSSCFNFVYADSVDAELIDNEDLVIENYYEFLKESPALFRESDIGLEQVIIEYEDAIEKFDTEILENVSAEERNSKVEEILEIESKLSSYLDEYTNDNNSFSRSSDYDENRKKLRQGNLIELTLDLDEGLSESDFLRIFSHAKDAKKIASNEYPNDRDLEDALRHFSWNFLSVKDSKIGTSKTRTATINHEWGLVLLKPVLNNYDKKYDEYIKDGYSEQKAASNALADTIIFIPYIKDMTVRACKKSYDFFKSIFSEDEIMDLHNNCYGRAYASEYPRYSALDAFNHAKRNDKLILRARNVTNSQYRYVWASEWYTY